MTPEAPDIDSSTREYAARFSGAIGQWFLNVQTRALNSLLSTPSNSCVLDVGGGHAQLVGPLFARGLKVTVQGSDQSCSQLLDTSQCDFKISALLALPFQDKSFDAVTCFRILPHLKAWPDLIAELCRLSRNEIIIEYPSSRSINALAPLLFKAKKKLEGNTRPYTLFSDRDINSEFARHGFVRKGEVRQFILPMVLYRAAKSVAFASTIEATLAALGLRCLFGSPVVARFIPST